MSFAGRRDRVSPGLRSDRHPTRREGVASYVIGSVLCLLVLWRKVFGGGNQDGALKNLCTHMKDRHRREQTTSKVQGKLALDRIRTSGEWAKPGATRHLAAYALLLMSTYREGSVEDRQAVAVCELLVQFNMMFQTEDKFLSDDMRDEIKKLGRNFTVLYSALAAKALAAGKSRRSCIYVHIGANGRSRAVTRVLGGHIVAH